MADPLAYRRFRDRPNLVFVNQVRDLILQTGMPEEIDTLYRAAISKTEPFQKLAQIDIPAGRRPDGDRAPCPMCVPNKFLSGFLVYVPRLQAVAFIGHCCADKDTLAAADREYRERANRDQQETYLLTEIPRVGERLASAEQLRPIAKDAAHVFQLFHRRGEAIQRQLRAITRRGGLLTLTETLDREAVGDGPRGFGSQGNLRDVQFGALAGTTALLTAFNPVRDLDKLCERLKRLEHGQTEGEALDFIVTLTESDRAFAYRELGDCDRAHENLGKRLADFAAFFGQDNLQRLNAWGSSPLNPESLRVVSFVEGDFRVVILSGSGCRVRLAISPKLLEL